VPELPIETERLSLRAFRDDDLEAVHAMHSREDVTRYLYWGPRSVDEVKEALATKVAATAIRAEGDVLFLAAELRSTGDLVGVLGLHYPSAAHATGEIGFIVHPDHHGHGYATEGACVLLRLAFDGLGLHRVTGHLEARNVASARVLEKLGMRREAHLVENELVKGEWQSEVVYAMLAREWSGR